LRGKGRGEASKDKSLTLVSIGVLEKDGATNGNEVKGRSNTSSRSVNGASSTIVDFRRKENSQSSWRLASSLRKGRVSRSHVIGYTPSSHK